jgi:hypothetical protein
MKKNIVAIVLTSFFFVLSFVITAQTNNPQFGTDDAEDITDPGAGGDGGDLGGGGAPIGGGTFILMALGAAYAGKKGYTLYKDNQAELED